MFLMSGVGLYAAEKSISFAWTPNTEPDMAQYVMYHRVEGQGYDYDIPIKIIPCAANASGQCVTPTVLPNGDCELNDLVLPIPDGSLTVNHFILRAEDGYGNQSGDSNEVTATYNLTSIVAISDFAGAYNKVTNTVDLTWSVTDNRITSWKIYKTLTSGTGYEQNGNEVMWNGTDNNITVSQSASAFAPGEVYYLVIVAFGPDGNSLNSNEISIDRKPPTTTINYRIKLTP